MNHEAKLNLLWDAGRKSVDLGEKYRDELGHELPGWRTAKDGRRGQKGSPWKAVVRAYEIPVSHESRRSSKPERRRRLSIGFQWSNRSWVGLAALGFERLLQHLL